MNSFDPNRDPARVEAYLARFLRGRVRLVHLNHSNPLHHPGPEREWLAARGLRAGLPGDRWRLD